MSGSMPSSQRPFFLSTFLAAFRQPSSSSPSPLTASASSQPNKHTSQASSAGPYSSAGAASAPRSIASSAAQQAASTTARSAVGQLPLHSPRQHQQHQQQQHGAMPIPQPAAGGRRRGSDSSSEGFREVMGADKWYIGGRTAGGEEKFFKMGVVRRVRSGDRLSIDRLSL